MANYEYKTVALPRSVAKRRRRRQTEAAIPAAYVVLIFKRSRESVWQRHAEEANPQNAMPAREPSPATQAQQAPIAAPIPPAPSPSPAPAAPAPQAAPSQPGVQFGSTSIQLVSNPDGASVTPMRPLGSAQD